MDCNRDEFFTRLYLEQFDFLYKTACFLLHDEHLGFDLAQETFLVAYLRIDELMQHPNPVGWLVQTMKYKLTHIKRDQKILLEFHEEIAAHADDGIDFEECESNWKERWLQVLSETEFALLKRYYGEGFPIQTVAQEFGLSVEACYKRFQRAKKKLRQFIEQK